MTVESSHTAFEFPYVVSDNQLKTSALLNFILGALALLAFVSMRGSLKTVGGVYQRRRELQDLFLQPPQLVLGGLQQAWSWITVVMCMSDADLVRTAGFDALMLNRTILLGLQIFSVLTLLSLVILLPTYYSFDDVVTHRLHRGTNVAELSRATISNLPPGHAILWLPALATYLVTGYCCWVLMVHCQSYAELRMAYILCLDAAGAQTYQERRPRRTLRRAPSSTGAGVRKTVPSLTALDPTGSGQPCNYPVCSGSPGGFQQSSAWGVAGLGQGTSGGVGPGSGSATPDLPLSAMPSAASLTAAQDPHAAAQAQAQLLPHRSLPHSQPRRLSQLHVRPHPHPPEARMRASLSASSLNQWPQEGPGAAPDADPVTVSSGGLQTYHVPGLARMSYGTGGVVAAIPPVGSAGSLGGIGAGMGHGAGAGMAPLAPHARGSMSLRVRLRLVAPWLRHVMVSAAERAARHKAADNLQAWVNPLRMLAKDREDWARQQLAADQDLDPSLPPVPSGQPPAATAAYGGLLVASEEMLMALTGRGDDVSDPRVGPYDWSDGVVALAESLGIWLRRRGGSSAGAGDRDQEQLLGAADKAQGESGQAGGGHSVGVRHTRSGSRGCADPVVKAATDLDPGARAPDAKSGANLVGIAKERARGNSFAALWLWPAKATAGATKAGPLKGAEAASAPGGTPGESSGRRTPAVYRYWAPGAEQVCFHRDLRRRHLRHAEAVAATRSDPATPLGYESTLNPVFERAAATYAGLDASAGGSTTDGGTGAMAGPAASNAAAGAPTAAVAAASRGPGASMFGGSHVGGPPMPPGGTVPGRRGVVPVLGGTRLGTSAGGGSASSLVGSGGGYAHGCPGPLQHSRLDGRPEGQHAGPVGPSGTLWYDVPLGDSSDGGGGVGAGQPGGAFGTRYGPTDANGFLYGEYGKHDDDDEGGGDSDERPWTGWHHQQQPLVVGRCNARLRQLLKVRHGGRCHLVNCHNYAVLVRDVVLRPVERFNAIGLPVLRSSVEVQELQSHGGCGKSGPRVGSDVEKAAGHSPPSARGAGFGGAGVPSRGAAAVELTADADGTCRCASVPVGAPAGRASSEGGARGDVLRSRAGEEPEDFEDDEHDPLLAGNASAPAADSDSGRDSGEGEHEGLLSPSGQQRRRRHRRHRPLLQPKSDLPLRDRAIHLVRELKQQQQQQRKAGGHLVQPELSPVGSRGRSGMDTGPTAGACAAAAPGGTEGGRSVLGADTHAAVELAAFVSGIARVSFTEAANGDPGGHGSTGGRAEEVLAAGASALAAATAPSASRDESDVPARGECGAAARVGAGMMPTGPDRNEPVNTTPWAASQGCLQYATAADATAGGDHHHQSGGGLAVGPIGGDSCVGLVPSPPPCMEVPIDDSEEAAAVAAYFAQLFPESFQRLVPVCNHRAVDELLFQWTTAMGHLASALLAAHVAVRTTTAPAPAALPPPKPILAAATATPPATPSARTASKSSFHHHHSSSASAAASASSPPAASGGGAGGQPLPPPLDLPPLDSCHCTAIRRAASAVRQLQDRITVERARALRTPTRRAYVALFSSQRDAAAAAQCSPLAPPSRAQPLHFKACAAPPPDSIYWPALWTLPTGRAARLLMSAPLLLVLVFPIGVLTGALANLPVAVCGGTPELNRLYWPWFCSRQNSHSLSSRLAKSLLTGVLPALLSLGWNAWVLPMALYLLSAIQSRCVSLPGMDRQMSRWFFWWSLLNMFLGAVVGGGIFQQLGAYLQDPGKVLLRIGTALPTASNFFMHYTLTKGLYSNWLRVAWPHLGAMAGAILRGMAGAALPRSWQDVFLIHSPPGYRFSSFYNGVFQTLMVGLAYVVTAPLIAPIALLFFVTAYVTWRYAAVYIYERQYESGGQMFPVVFDHMFGYLLVAELFTGAVLLTNGGWIQAALLWASLTPAVVAFRDFCTRRYLRPLEHPPMSLAMAAPPAAVDAAVFLPPALREGSAGWYPESGKVWEQYGIPKYVI